MNNLDLDLNVFLTVIEIQNTITLNEGKSKIIV